MADNNPDLSEFLTFRTERYRRKICVVRTALNELAPDEAEKLVSACEADKGIINAGAIVKWLDMRGYETNAQAVYYHRDKRCSCYG